MKLVDFRKVCTFATLSKNGSKFFEKL